MRNERIIAMDFKKNHKNFTAETDTLLQEISSAVCELLHREDVRELLECYCAYENPSEVYVYSFDSKTVRCCLYYYDSYEHPGYYEQHYAFVPLEYLTNEGALDAALAQRRAEQDAKERRMAELQNDPKFQEYLKLKEQFKDV